MLKSLQPSVEEGKDDDVDQENETHKKKSKKYLK